MRLLRRAATGGLIMILLLDALACYEFWRYGPPIKALDEGPRSIGHPNPKRGNPHFHSADSQGKKKPSSTHHIYPE